MTINSKRVFGVTNKRAVLALIVLVAAQACAGSNQRSAPSAVVGNSDVARDARLLAMTDTRKLDTALVDELLADRDSDRRARAALAIGQVKGQVRYARLRQLLVDADTAVAANAAFALGLAKDTNAIYPLARALAGAPDAVAVQAAWSLGDIGEPARAVLLLALGEGQSQPLVSSTAAQRSALVRAALVTAVSKLRNTPATVVIPWAADTDVRVVRAAAYVLGRTRAVAGTRAMLGLRSSADEETRQHVARALVRASAGDSLSARALDALHALMNDSSARVRANAVRSLATFGASTKDAVLKGLHDRDGNVRVSTAEVVPPLLGSNAASWRAAWTADTTLPVRVALLTASRRTGNRVLGDAEDAWMKSVDWRQRLAVLQARRADSARAPHLADIAWGLRDVDGRVRSAAVNAFRDVVRGDPSTADTARKLMLGLLTDADVQVRSTAISGMRAAANALELPRILQAYTIAASDQDNDVRLAAISYVAAAWQRDSARFDAALRQQLTSLPIPRDSTERAASQTTTPLVAWRSEGNASSVRSLADYEVIVRRYVAPNAKPLTGIIHTEHGDIIIALDGRNAPLTVDNFVKLSRRGYYRNTFFHRVVPNFVAQDGDSRGDGTGGPGYAIRDELNRQIHTRGSVAMALSGPDTGGRQYYLCHSPQPHLDGHYTVFGHVMQGYDVLDRIVQGDRILSIEVR